MKYVLLISLLFMGCKENSIKVGDCYTGEDPLVKIVKVLDYGVEWETQLPYNNIHANTTYYTTFKEFLIYFERSDCWADKK